MLFLNHRRAHRSLTGEASKRFRFNNSRKEPRYERIMLEKDTWDV